MSVMNSEIEQFLEDASSFGIQLTISQLEFYEAYYQLLIDWNNRMNLTAITDAPSVFTKHFLDSLLLDRVEQFNPAVRLLDVGAGAGFPSVPVKILHSSLSITILDSLQKRIVFLEELFRLLKFADCDAIHGRAEDYGQNLDYREKFHQVTARAVAKLSVLAEFCLPFVKNGGFFFALKGIDVGEEVKDASAAVQKLGGSIEDVLSFQLPRGAGERSIIVVRKIGNTPWMYPRKAGLPAKSPLS